MLPWRSGNSEDLQGEEMTRPWREWKPRVGILCDFESAIGEQFGFKVSGSSSNGSCRVIS